MSGAVIVGDLTVIVGALICVADHERDGGACGLPLKNAGEDFYLVRFLSLGGKT